MKYRKLIPALVVLVLICAVTAAFFLSRPTGNELYASVNVASGEETGQGMALDGVFQLTTGYRVSQDELRAMLSVEPDIGEFTMTGKGKSWTLTPAAPLAANTIYTIQIANPATGEIVQSFAFQTKSDLQVNTVFPADKSSYVSVNSGIEVTFNAPDVDMSRSFEIKPEVAGSFEVNGYTAIFKPDEPLAVNNIYRITVKAGLTAPGGMRLAQDYKFTFETTDEDSGRQDYELLRLTGNYAETFLVGDPLAVEMMTGSELPANQEFEVKVNQFGDINGYIKELKSHDAYYADRYGEKTEYVANITGLEEVAAFKGRLLQKEENGLLYAVLPDEMPAGWYIATISGKDADGRELFVQKLLQICTLSVYTQSVNGDVLVWLNDPTTGQPMADVEVELDDRETATSKKLITQADGTARAMAVDYQAGYLSVLGEGGKVLYFDGLALSDEAEAPLSERFYAALYTDREIYRPNDTVRFWGVVKPRKVTSALPKTIYAAINTGWPESEVYRVKASVNADGTFEGTIPITGLRKDWYRMVISDGEGGSYTAKGLDVQDYTKPAYVITATPDKDFYYINEQVHFAVSATYFDGTPLSGGELTFYGGAYMQDGGITLDASGKATYTTPLKSVSDDESGLSSWAPRSAWYGISNADPEDVQISVDGSLTVLPSAIAAQVENDGQGGYTVRTAKLDDTKLKKNAVQPLDIFGIYGSEFEALKGENVDQNVSLLIHEAIYTKIPSGSYYDYVNKRNVIRYEYERSERIAQTLSLQTKDGVAVVSGLPYENTEDRYYWAEARLDGGVSGQVSVSENVARYARRFDDRKTYTFAGDAGVGPLEVGETFRLGLYENGVPLENHGRVLYTAVQRNILANGVFAGGGQDVTMQEDFLPDVTFAGAYFDGRHVYSIDPMHVFYKYDSKTLQVAVSTDKADYRPGEKASVTLTITDRDGKPAAGSACIGVVDESVFALREQKLDFAGQLYTGVFYPNLNQSTSYDEGAAADAIPNSGGAMLTGGGGGTAATLRKDFQDMALFQAVTVDESGKATVEVALPDNVTSWRITAAAVTADLKAGDGVSAAVATLPFYARPLFTDSYLVGDDVAMAVSGVGTGVSPGAEVTYTVTIRDGSSEVDRLTGTGAVGERVPFNFGKYDAGRYSMTVTAGCGEYADTVEQPFDVLEKALTVPVYKNMALADLSQLTSVRWPVQLYVYDTRMAPYMDGLQKLSSQNGERTEAAVAAYMAKLAYNGLLDPAKRETVYKDPRLDTFQLEDGGIRLLSVGGSDPAVTAKLLVAAPQLLNREAAKQYLQSMLKNPAATPDDRVMAYMGLAAAKTPLLLDITRILETDTTLTTAQRLYLGVGLAKLGDYTSAERIYASLGETLMKEGDMAYVEGEGMDGRIQNTAAALMLTSITANPDADSLMRFLTVQGNDRARSAVQTQLEMLAYIESFTVPTGGSTAKFSYTDAQGVQQQVTLEQGAKAFTMGYEEFHSAKFKALHGDSAVSVRYTALADPAEDAAASKPNVTKVTKTITPIGGTLQNGGRVRVDLKVEFDPSAPAGSYAVTDYIPSGMRFMEQANSYGGDYFRSDLDHEGQTVMGAIYRAEPEEPVVQEEAADEEAGESMDAIIPSTEEETPNEYTLTYYANAALSGEFVVESAWVTPQTQGPSAKSQRTTIIIP